MEYQDTLYKCNTYREVQAHNQRGSLGAHEPPPTPEPRV